MTPTTYQLASLRTVNPELSPRERLLEAALGICGEASEIYDARLIRGGTDKRAEEIGDLCWYHAQVMDLLGLDPEVYWSTPCRMEHPKKSYKWYCTMLFSVSGSFANRVQKHAFQGHDQELFSPSLRALAGYTAGIAWKIGYTMPEIWAMNIQKLEARYPNGFTVAASVDRSAT